MNVTDTDKTGERKREKKKDIFITNQMYPCVLRLTVFMTNDNTRQNP